MTCHILCTHNGFALPKFILADVLPMIFHRNCQKPFTTTCEGMRNLPPHKTQNQGRIAWLPRYSGAQQRKVGSTFALGAKGLDQTDLEMNIGK